MSLSTSIPSQPSTCQPTHPAHTLLSHAHPPSTSISIFTDKILHKPLLLTTTTTTTTQIHTRIQNPVQSQAQSSGNSNSSDSRAKRRHIRQRKKEYYLKHARPRPLSARERRAAGLFDLDFDSGLTHGSDLAGDGDDDSHLSSREYEVYAGLNELWNGYILELLGFTRAGVVVEHGNTGGAGGGGSSSGGISSSRKKGGVGSASRGGGGSGDENASELLRKVTAASAGSLLASADYHGMEIEVVRCADVARVGLKGIVIRETRSTFTIICDERERRKDEQKKKRQTRGEASHEAEKKPEHGNSQFRPEDTPKSESRSKLPSEANPEMRSETRTETELKPSAAPDSKSKSNPSPKHKEQLGDTSDRESITETDLDDSTKQAERQDQTRNFKQTERCKTRTILKKGAVFRVAVRLPFSPQSGSVEEIQTLDFPRQQQPQQQERRYQRLLVVDLHGAQLEMRPVERAVKKFKWRVGGFDC